MTDLPAAVAHIKLLHRPFTRKDFENWTPTAADYFVSILNAVASGDIVPRADVEGLHDVYWKLRSYAVHDDGCKINKPPYTIGSCSCGLTASLAKGETILTAWENRNDR